MRLAERRTCWARSYDETIRGHVFCSFLALLLPKEIEDRLAARGWGDLEWASVIRDLDRVEEIELEQDGKRFLLRTEAVGVAGKVFQAAGVALPPAVQPAAQLSPRGRSAAGGRLLPTSLCQGLSPLE